MNTKLNISSVGVALVLLISGAVNAQVVPRNDTSRICGPLRNLAFGPFDYRQATEEQKNLVEGAHFPPMVETLQKGHRGHLAGDIDYTLRAFPNHPRALSAMTRLAKREGTRQPYGALYPVECYYDRALRFTPDDPWPRVLYAFFLIDGRRFDEARYQLSKASAAVEDDPQLLYNVGLAYFNLGDYPRSEEFARRAYANGVQFSALRNMLQSKGKLKD